jgi:hypothetical protein
MGGDERERGDRAAAAREDLDRAGAERLDQRVQILRLDRRRVVDPPVLARAAPEAARVIGDHGAVGEVRRQRGEARGVHGLTDHQQRRASVGGGQRAADVVGDLGVGVIEDVRGRHGRSDRSRGRELTGSRWWAPILRHRRRAGGPVGALRFRMCGRRSWCR